MSIQVDSQIGANNDGYDNQNDDYDDDDDGDMAMMIKKNDDDQNNDHQGGSGRARHQFHSRHECSANPPLSQVI